MDTYLQKLVNNNQTQLMLDTIFDAIYIVDTNRTIVYWNKGAEQITGYTKSEVMGKKCANNILNHIDEQGRLLCKSFCPLVNAMQNDLYLTEKVYPLCKNKNRIPTTTHISPIKNDEGEIVGAIEVFRDISTEEAYRTLQEKFKRVVQKYISNTTYHQIVDQLQHNNTQANALKDLTILYLDIVDFTTLSEKLFPGEVADLLNNLFGICDVITRECHGDIDKFIGDSIMATFIDANDAVRAASNILDALKLFNGDRIKSGESEIKLRFGINSGNVVQVEVGTHDRKDFTVIGDTVNTASRIESISEPNTIYISEQTYIKLSEKEPFEFVGTRSLKGKGINIDVYKYIYK
jgi:PAS domain S-box-containing protein